MKDLLLVINTASQHSWDSSWNTNNRPVVWGCSLSADKTYAVSYKKPTIDNPSATNGIKALYRQGHNFIEWNTASDGSSTSYAVEELNSVPVDEIVYAIWEPIE